VLGLFFDSKIEEAEKNGLIDRKPRLVIRFQDKEVPGQTPEASSAQKQDQSGGSEAEKH